MLYRIFDTFNKNDDGNIIVMELGNALDRLSLLIPLPDLESIFKDFFQAGGNDFNFDGFIALDNSVGEKLFCYNTLTTELIIEEV